MRMTKLVHVRSCSPRAALVQAANLAAMSPATRTLTARVLGAFPPLDIVADEDADEDTKAAGGKSQVRGHTLRR
jgi:hypothetical protein